LIAQALWVNAGVKLMSRETPVGVVTLETLGLEVDPAAGRLKEAETHLL
jgi:predicted aspartyl protease